MIRIMIDRRRFLFSTTILAAVGTATFGWAADAKDAEVLVTNLVADINAVISSGSSESVMVRQFEKIFESYADVPTIARYALGKVADLVLDPMGFVLNPWQSRLRTTTNVGNVLGNRAALGSTIDSVLYDSADSYAQTKLAYLQGRRFRLNPEISEVYSDPYDEMND